MLGTGAIVMTAVGSGILTLDFLSPRVLLEPARAFKAGPINNYSPGSVTLDSKRKTYIVREKEGYFYTLSAVCTHLGCLTRWKEDEGIIACPCHGSKFRKTGEVIDGPAPSALPRYLVSLNDRGELVVDRGVFVDENQILKV